MANTTVGVRDEPDAPLAEIAVDRIAGADYQRVKLDLGAEGAVAPVVGAMPISAAALPLPTGAATEASVASTAASTAVMDDWDEADRAKVNPIVGQAGVAAGEGATGATVQRVTQAQRTLTPAAPTFATVGVASAEALAADATRKRIILVNTSANLISLAFAAAAVLGSGITLAPYGSVTLDEKTDGTSAVQGQIRAIAGAAASNLGVQSFT